MKKNIFTKMGAAAVVLTLVTASLVGGTFAKYVTTTTGTTSVTAAKWNVAFASGASDFTSDIVLTGTGENNTILPDDTGTLAIDVDGTGSDVGFTYNVKVTPTADAITGFKFYTDNTYATEIPSTGLDGTVAYSATADAMKATETIYWKWTSTDDATDTAEQGKKAAFTIDMHAEQNASPTAP